MTIFITHPMFRTHLVIQTVIFIVSACVAWIAFARQDAGRFVSAKQFIDDPGILRRRRLHWPYYLIDPRRRPQEIGDDQNPVFIKEKRVGALAKSEALIRGSYIGLAFSLLLVFRTSIRADSFDAMKDLALWAIGFIIVFMPVLAATSLSKEREENTMDLLRATMLTSWQIVWAKFLIALRFLAVLGLSVVIIPAVVRIVVPPEGWAVENGFSFPREAPVTPVKMIFSFLNFLRIAPFVLAFAALYAAVGTVVSCWARRNATAIIITYLLVLVLLLAPMLPIYVAGLLDGSAAGDPGFDSIGAAGREVSPGFMAWPLHWFLHYFCPLISPYWYFTDHGLYPHAFAHWRNWIQIVLHTALVLALTGLLLKAGAARLNASPRT